MMVIRTLHTKARVALGLLAVEAGIDLDAFWALPLPVFLKLLREKRAAEKARRVS